MLSCVGIAYKRQQSFNACMGGAHSYAIRSTDPYVSMYPSSSTYEHPPPRARTHPPKVFFSHNDPATRHVAGAHTGGHVMSTPPKDRAAQKRGASDPHVRGASSGASSTLGKEEGPRAGPDLGGRVRGGRAVDGRKTTVLVAGSTYICIGAFTEFFRAFYAEGRAGVEGARPTDDGGLPVPTSP